MCARWFFFFFKQKTAYEMRISDWSSDACSSDLDAGMREFETHHARKHAADDAGDDREDQIEGADVLVVRRHEPAEDRKSVVEGKSVSVRVDLGGRRINNKKSIDRK